MNAHYLLWYRLMFDRRCAQAARYGMLLWKFDPLLADRGREIHREVELERLERSRQLEVVA